MPARSAAATAKLAERMAAIGQANPTNGAGSHASRLAAVSGMVAFADAPAAPRRIQRPYKANRIPKAKLRQEQKDGSAFIYKRNKSLLLADVGTGKTITILNALDQWMKEGIVDRAIIFAPKRVCLQVWVQEMRAWDNLDVRDFCPGMLAGQPPSVRDKIIKHTKFKVLIANYELMPWITKHYPDGIPSNGKTAIIFDEIDKMKSHTSLRWKGKVRRLTAKGELNRKLTGQKIVDYVKRYDENTVLLQPGAKHWIENFDIRLGATGTPTPNTYLELWAQTYLIDKGERLGDDFRYYKWRYFFAADSYYNKYAKVECINPKAIEKRIEDIVFHMSHAEDMPHINELPTRWVNLNDKGQRIYKKFEYEAILQAEQGIVEAISAGALWQKCRQLSSGFVYGKNTDEETGEEERFSEWIDDCKHKELDNLLSELQGAQAIIVYDYEEQAKRLKKDYPDMQCLDGRTSDTQASAIIEQWNSGKLQLLGIHPKSAGHGLNLQKSHCRHIIFITLPMSAGEYKQVVGRIARRGGAKHIFVHKILSDQTQDIEDLARVEGKITTLTGFLAAMKERTQFRRRNNGADQ